MRLLTPRRAAALSIVTELKAEVLHQGLPADIQGKGLIACHCFRFLVEDASIGVNCHC